MCSAKIINFPSARRRRPIRPAPVCHSAWPSSGPNGGFTLLLFVTIPAAFLYLSGTVKIARHDALYAGLLVAVWGLYFSSDKLLRTRFAPLLMLAGRLVVIGAAAVFFGGVYWLIL